MKHIDAVRGFQRDILFEPRGGYATSGGVALSDCVVETVEFDWQGQAPALSVRFYNKPANGKWVREMDAQGHKQYEEGTPIGIEINLGPELANSLIEQLMTKWPEYLNVRRIIEDQGPSD